MKTIAKSCFNTGLLTKNLFRFGVEAQGMSEGASFLQMVENYFDKAGKHTNISSDRLNFYKKPECVVKFNLTLIRGKK